MFRYLVIFIFVTNVSSIQQLYTRTNFQFISAKADYLLAVDRAGIVNRQVEGHWEKLPSIGMVGKAVSVAASPDGWHSACDDVGKVYRFNPSTSAWEPVGVFAIQSASFSKDTIVVVNWNSPKELWKSSAGPTGWTNSQYTDLPKQGANGQPSAKWVSIGTDGETWIIDQLGAVYRRNEMAKSWEPIPIINAVNLDVENRNTAVVTTTCGGVYAWNGSSFSKWNIAGCSKQATISKGNAWYLDELQNIQSMYK